MDTKIIIDVETISAAKRLVPTHYLIYSNRSNSYFEQDFAGWSWASKDYAYKFRTKEEAIKVCDALELPHDYVIKIES